MNKRKDTITQKERERKETERQDFSLLKESDLLHQRRRKHGTTIRPPATFIITPSIKHGCGLHWRRRRGERRGLKERKGFRKRRRGRG